MFFGPRYILNRQRFAEKKQQNRSMRNVWEEPEYGKIHIPVNVRNYDII